jgi:nucleoside permease NupC
MEGLASSRSVSRRFHSLRGSFLVVFQQSTKGCVENVERMTRSELFLVLTTGMATVASSTLGVYVAFLTGVFPTVAGHLISASVLAIPASVVVAKLQPIPERW